MTSQDVKDILQKRPLSYSSLKQFAISPKTYVNYLTTKKEATPAQSLGSLLDIMILTPDRFLVVYFVLDDLEICGSIGGAKPRATNLYKDWKEGQLQIAGDKIIIEKEQYEQAQKIFNSVQENAVACEYLERLQKTQISFKWQEKETGLPVVSKVDGEADKFILELKTTKDASPEGFIRECLNYDYDLQCAIYLEGYKRKFFKFPYYIYLAVETTEPYNVAVHKASDDYLAYGIMRFKKIIQQFQYCLDKDFWNQSYEFHSQVGYHELDLPQYLKRSLE